MNTTIEGIVDHVFLSLGHNLNAFPCARILSKDCIYLGSTGVLLTEGSKVKLDTYVSKTPLNVESELPIYPIRRTKNIRTIN